MKYLSRYRSPLGPMLLAADDIGLTGVWFLGQKHFPSLNGQELETEVLMQARHWLDVYFSGAVPAFLPPLHLGGTPFQESVWNLLLTIPYGETRTYGQLARALGVNSAQAVGGAVGRNPVSIVVPCHRCVGASGSLTGYAGGLERKKALLELEKGRKNFPFRTFNDMIYK